MQGSKVSTSGSLGGRILDLTRLQSGGLRHVATVGNASAVHLTVYHSTYVKGQFPSSAQIVSKVR